MLLISNVAFSQSYSEEEFLEIEKLRVHFAPLNLFDPVTGVLQLGVQKTFSQRLAVSLDHGMKMKVFDRGGTGKQGHTYSKTKAELKYFLDIKKRVIWSRVFSYLAIEGMYFPQKYSREDNWVYRGTTYYRYDYSKINRPVWVASLKYGQETRYRKVVIDKFIGLGVRRLSVKHQTIGEREDHFDHDEWSIGFRDIEEGIFEMIHVSLGVKFGLPIYW
ncbi:hypothetical protein DC20_15575 [Rufibacter tibetensis]|uniref:DUF3575 domain-containing protein n=2 Tax=Rufibacter tibetensis TaxID=512763 RepID=A0A0P0CRS0_9BACT|nr:hypothetical protein DC20_15575 [Rufibacter tibetensis]